MGPRGPLDMLFNERIDALTPTSIVTDLDRMVVVTEMNASLLSCVISVDVEDPYAALSSALRRLLTNPIVKS